MEIKNTQLNFEASEFDIEKSPEHITEKFLDYIVGRIISQNPGDPPPNREVLRKSFFQKNPHQHTFRFVAYSQDLDKIVGSGFLAYEAEASPAYEENKHVCYGGVGVDENYRNQGVGRALINLVVEKATHSGTTIMSTSSDEPSGKAYLKSLDFGILELEGAENRLYLENVDWDVMKNWDDEGKDRNQQARLVAFTDVPNDLIEQYTKFYTEAMNSVPKGEEEWVAKFTPESRRIDEQRQKERGNIWYSLISVEKDSTISGVTEILHNPEETHVAYQELTAVLPRYRGRGIGKWLKANMLLFIHDKYPDIEYIVTGNADVNAPMLAINEKMGYKRYKSGVSYKFKIADLVDYYLDK